MASKQLWFLFIQTIELQENLRGELPLRHSGQMLDWLPETQVRKKTWNRHAADTLCCSDIEKSLYLNCTVFKPELYMFTAWVRHYLPRINLHRGIYNCMILMQSWEKRICWVLDLTGLDALLQESMP